MHSYYFAATSPASPNTTAAAATTQQQQQPLTMGMNRGGMGMGPGRGPYHPFAASENVPVWFRSAEGRYELRHTYPPFLPPNILPPAPPSTSSSALQGLSNLLGAGTPSSTATASNTTAATGSAGTETGTGIGVNNNNTPGAGSATASPSTPARMNSLYISDFTLVNTHTSFVTLKLQAPKPSPTSSLSPQQQQQQQRQSQPQQAKALQSSSKASVNTSTSEDGRQSNGSNVEHYGDLLPQSESSEGGAEADSGSFFPQLSLSRFWRRTKTPTNGSGTSSSAGNGGGSSRHAEHSIIDKIRTDKNFFQWRQNIKMGIAPTSTDDINTTDNTNNNECTFMFTNSGAMIKFYDFSTNILMEAISFVSKIKPTCHDVNLMTRRADQLELVVGFDNAMIMIYDPLSRRQAYYNKNGMMNGSPVTCINWIPGDRKSVV